MGILSSCDFIKKQFTKRDFSLWVQYLNHEDPNAVRDTAGYIHSMSNRPAEALAMGSDQQLIVAVLSLMNSGREPEIIKHAVGTLYNVSRHPNGLMTVLNSDAIPVLLRLLSSPNDAVVYYAITTLHNLVTYQENAKEAVRHADGVPRLITLLKTKNLAKFLAIVVDCLYNLAFNNQKTKTIILHQGGPTVLVRIMETSNYERLLLTTARLLQTLSICPENKNAIVDAGGFQAFARHLKHESPQHFVRTILLATRNLSDVELKEENVESLLLGLLRLIGSADSVVVFYSVCILSNITCNNIRNKTFICSVDGVPMLMRTLERPLSEAKTVEAALRTLRHLTTRHPDADRALEQVRLYRNIGLRLIAEYVQIEPPVPLICVKTAMGLIRNLCSNAIAFPSLYEFKVVHNVCDRLIASYERVQQAQRTNTPSPIIDDVMCEEMVECCLNVLQILVKDGRSRKYMCKTEIITVLVQLLSYEKNDNKHIQRVAADLLSDLVNDPHVPQMIEGHVGAVARLTELLHSPSEDIAAYAAVVLQALGRNTPEDYQKHLRQELTTSLLRDDSAPWGQDGLEEMPQMYDDGLGDLMYPDGFDAAMNFDQMLTNSPASDDVPDYDAVDTTSHLPPPQYGPQSAHSIHQQQQRPMNESFDTDL